LKPNAACSTVAANPKAAHLGACLAEAVTTLYLDILILTILILLNGLFVLAEMAVVSSRRARLQQAATQGNRGAQTALHLLVDPSRFLSTVQIGITLIATLTGAFGGAKLGLILKPVLETVPLLAPHAESLAFGAVVIAITFFSLILGELVPKRLALANAEFFAAKLSPLMAFLTRLLGPFGVVLVWVSNWVIKALPNHGHHHPEVSDEEVNFLMQQGFEAGLFHAKEKEMVDMVLRFGDRKVNSVMTPRTQILWLDITDDPSDIKKIIASSLRSRFPLMHDNMEQVIGVVEVKKLLARELLGESFDLRAAADPALYVPETAPAIKALELIKQHHAAMALVVDEYGDIQGLVTVTDLLEALVGDLPSPTVEDKPLIVQREDGSWLVDGILPLEDIESFFPTLILPEADDGGVTTIGGLMMSQLKRIPNVADHFHLGNYRLEVMDMDGRRVDKILVTQED
jgi:putative hemolysin